MPRARRFEEAFSSRNCTSIKRLAPVPYGTGTLRELCDETCEPDDDDRAFFLLTASKPASVPFSAHPTVHSVLAQATGGSPGRSRAGRPRSGESVVETDDASNKASAISPTTRAPKTARRTDQHEPKWGEQEDRHDPNATSRRLCPI